MIYYSDKCKNYYFYETSNSFLSETTKINEMWSPYHKRYVPRCFEDCGNKGAFQDFDIPVDSDTHLKQLLNK